MLFGRASSFRCSAPCRTAGGVLASRGYGRSGNSAGPLRDLPDWEFADGRPAPVSKGRKRSENEKKRTESRIAAARAAFPSDPEQLRIAILEGKKGLYKREFEKKATEEKAVRKTETAQRKKELKAKKAAEASTSKSKNTKSNEKKDAKPEKKKEEDANSKKDNN